MMIGPERRRERQEAAKKGKKARKSKKRAAVEAEPAATTPPAEPVVTAVPAVAPASAASAEPTPAEDPPAPSPPRAVTAPAAIALLPHLDRLRAQVDALLVAAAPVALPAAPAARADAAEPSGGPPPALRSAVLVARELLQRGVPAERVRERLAAGYGVEDPDAVLVAAGAA